MRRGKIFLLGTEGSKGKSLDVLLRILYVIYTTDAVIYI